MDNVLIKSGLTTQQLAIIQSEVDKNKKSAGIMYLLWWFTGLIGGHRYYLGDVWRGVFMTLTLGGVGVWALIDVFFISGRLRHKTELLELETIKRIKGM